MARTLRLQTSVNFVSRVGKRYSSVQCTDALSVTETTRPLLKGEWVMSYFKQTTIQRSCAEKNRATFESCFDTVIGQAEAFVAGVEKLKMTFSPTYLTSWGVNAPPDEVIINHKDGRKEIFYTNKPDPSETPDQPVISLEDLLALADIDLEKQNEEANGFQADDGIPLSAPHRFMGGNLVIELEIRNIDYFKPFSTKVIAELKVERAKISEPYGPGVEVIYKGSLPVTLQSHDEVRVEREWHGFSLQFEGAGLVGIIDPLALIAALTNAFVLVGMCTLAVDKIGEFFSEQFYDDKYEDDEERAGLEKMLLNMVGLLWAPGGDGFNSV